MFVLPALPYPYGALAPTVSDATMHVHHDKHHAKYVETVNQLVGKAGLRAATLEEVVRQAKAAGDKKLFNNAAQAWNHGFFWLCMTPDRSEPEVELRSAIARDFGGLDKLREAFVAEGVNQFGSGWVWLVLHEGALKVFSTHDADTPIVREGCRPLLVCDLWEHAYYLDYKNDRKGFLEAWFDKVADWRFASHQLTAREGWTYPERVAESA